MVFTALFGTLLLVHVWQAVTYKKASKILKPPYMSLRLIRSQKFCWVIIMAALWETVAFTFRTLSTRYQQNTTFYLIFQIFILLAPLCASTFASLLWLLTY